METITFLMGWNFLTALSWNNVNIFHSSRPSDAYLRQKTQVFIGSDNGGSSVSHQAIIGTRDI